MAGFTLVLTPTDYYGNLRPLASASSRGFGTAPTYHVTRVLGNNIGVDVVESKVGEPSVEKPYGDGQETTDTQSSRNHLVRLSCSKHLLGEGTVGDGVTVV